MPLKQLQINKHGIYGKIFKNKIIKFDPKINFIIGENATGKSAILNEIKNRTNSSTKSDKDSYIYFDSEKMNPRVSHSINHVFDVYSQFMSHGETLISIFEEMKNIKEKKVILLDEPENGISPWNQKKQLKLFEELSSKHQLIISTHSMIYTKTNIGQIIKLTKRTINYIQQPSTFDWNI